jgi:hypothetical protein
MNPLISIGLSVAVAPAILLAIGRLIGSPDTITVAEAALFGWALPVGGLLVIVGLVRGGTHRVEAAHPKLFQEGQRRLGRMARNINPMGPAPSSPASYLYWWLASFVLFGIALFLPFESDVAETSPTWFKLLFGWIYVLTGETTVWLSAPLLLASWICFYLEKPRATMILSAAALGIALPFLAHPSVTYGWGDSIHTRQQTPEIGYFLILGSTLVNFIGSARFMRSKLPEGHRIPVSVLATCFAAAIGPASLLGTSKVWEVVSARRQVEAVQDLHVDRAAKDLARHWEKKQILDQNINEIPHGPPGTIPEWLDVKRMRFEIEILNRRPDPIQVDVWIAYTSPSGNKVVCKFFQPGGTPNARGDRHFSFGPTLSAGEAVTLEINYPSIEFYDGCRASAGRAPLEFAVNTGDRKRILFLTDTAFGPAPPPRAEWKIEY